MKKNLQNAILVSLIMSVCQIGYCLFMKKIPHSAPNVVSFWLISAIVSVMNLAAIISAFTYSPKEKKARFLLIIVLPILGILASANHVFVIGTFAFATFVVTASFLIWDHDYVTQ